MVRIFDIGHTHPNHPEIEGELLFKMDVGSVVWSVALQVIACGVDVGLDQGGVILPDLELRTDAKSASSNVRGHNTHSAVEPHVGKTALKSSQVGCYVGSGHVLGFAIHG